jgi:bacterioferritin
MEVHTLMNKKAKDNSKLPDLLNRALALEYTLIVHYPRIASAIRDAETKRLAQSLGTASADHFDAVSNTITELGGTPVWSFEPFPGDMDLKRIFQIQLEKEKLALDLHRQIAGIFTDLSLRKKFERLSREELDHIETAEKILSRLE